MKKLFLTIMLAILAVSVSAGNLGTDYFGIGAYPKAKVFFESELSTNPVEANYYLGEIAFATGNKEEAIKYFNKGIAADPQDPFNRIGKGKALLKSNPKEAEALFALALSKKFKKDPDANVSVARAYFENGFKEETTQKLNIARKLAKKSPSLFILEGDILTSEGKKGEDAGMYEQAIYFNPNNFIATIKSAQVYEIIQPSLAVEKLEPLLAVYPDYTIINRYLARAYNAAGQYPLAIKSYVKYYGEDDCDSADIRYLASAYYFTNQFAKSIQFLDKGLALDPNNFVFNRLRMYNASKLQDVENGLTLANKFFSMTGTFIDKDYSAYALILADAGKYDEALVQFSKVIAADTTKAEPYMDLATVYTKMREYVKSAESYQKYIDLNGGPDYANPSDYYSMGKAYYYAGQQFRKDSTDASQALAKEYLIKADTAFGVVCNRSPTSYFGFIWRGHTNSALDPETTLGLAKPYYEQALKLILARIEAGEDKELFRKDLVTIYMYQAYSSFLLEDKVNTLLYANKIIELDPSNKNAKIMIDAYNPQPVAPTKK